MSIFEYNKEEEELKLRKAEYEAGVMEGEARLSMLITLLLNDGKEAEIQQVLTNPVFREEMYKKIWQILSGKLIPCETHPESVSY